MARTVLVLMKSMVELVNEVAIKARSGLGRIKIGREAEPFCTQHFSFDLDAENIDGADAEPSNINSGHHARVQHIHS